MPVRNDSAQEHLEDDAWEKVINSKSGGGSKKADENGFDKFNTNFYLKDGESAVIQFLEDIPHIIKAHNVKLRSKAGKPYFVYEACQKSTQDSCGWCESKKPAVGFATDIAVFVILDKRGAYNRETGEFAGEPVPMLWLVSMNVAKIIKGYKDDLGGDLTDVVTKCSKIGKNYQLTASITKDRKSGAMYYETPQPYDGPIPDVDVIYAPANDKYIGLVTSDMPDKDDDAGDGGNSGRPQHQQRRRY